MAEEIDEKESHARSHLPYSSEYCVTDRARCHRCTNTMAKDSLKLASLVKSRFHDGYDKHWHHVDCFFQIKRPHSVAEIRHFEALRYEDQKLLERAIETNGLSVLEDLSDRAQNNDGENLGRKPKAKKRQPKGQFLNYHDFLIDYAKTGRATCNLCNTKIAKSSVRIGKYDYEYEASWAGSDPITRWFHVECFDKAAEQLEFYGNVWDIDDFDNLDDDDQKAVKDSVKPRKPPKASTLASKKIKIEANNNEEEFTEEDRMLKEQSDRFFELRDEVSKMKLDDIRLLLGHMKQKANFKISSKLIDQATDVLLFGPIQRCPSCRMSGGIHLSGSSYICTQALEWGSCSYETRDPKRDMPDVPDFVLKKYPWFKTDYEFHVGKRIFPCKLIKAVEEREAELNGDVQDGGGPLDGLTLAVASWSSLKHTKAQIQKKVTMLGGKISTVIDRTAFVVLSSKDEYDSEAPKVEVAKGLNIPFASDSFIFDVQTKSDVVACLSKSLINQWDGNLEERFTAMNVNQLKVNIKSRSRAHQAERVYKSSSAAKSQSIVVKDGTVVDPESNLVEVGRVYRQGAAIYNVVLNNIDVSRDKNSFYKIQVIEHETRKEYYMFRAWGRIGCAGVGNNLVHQADSLDAALEEFEGHFKDKTGNSFTDYVNGSFRKVHGFYYPVDVDYSDPTAHEDELKLEYDPSSSLERSVQGLICFIFDIQRMQKAMKRLELDNEKMPLGKLSERHILDAMDTLKELESALEVKPPKKPNKRKLTMLTNKFYTLIPQSFGDGSVQLISSIEQVSDKNQMLAELKEIEIAYKMSLSIKTDSVSVPVDQYYTKLSCSIKALGCDDSTYKMIADYVSLNHASTHGNYKLFIQDIFQVEREGDMKRFKKHKKKERALLWHGSRATNFAGILSQGLRIAPPEAPSTGFMFGKGIYFADMCSKAANYCLADPSNDRGLLLLCEVALGKAHELLESDADMPANLPQGCHCIKGLGKSIPNPKTHLRIEKDLIVPIGKQTPNKGVNSQLLYNEYVVYDEAQTLIRYIVDAKFEFR